MDMLRFMVARLEGEKIESDFARYEALARGGAAGFIVFGGEVEALREGVRGLQAAAEAPLIVCSDLEQGLGQQIRGGTLFPPAMALGQASVGPALAGEAFSQMAREAAYAGINTILAPVLDINTNPRNPIISTRAFGGDPETVSALAVRMIEAFRAEGIKSCGKHFPGHGDTGLDSHIGLPTITKTLPQLEGLELMPFRRAVRAGVDMIMLGHLSVPALDPGGIPASVSERTVSYLRNEIGYRGILTTDAMNMGGLGDYTEDEAALSALRAGVDVLLHPREPERLAASIKRYGGDFSAERLFSFRKSLRVRSPERPSFDRGLSIDITRKAIRVEGRLRPLKNPVVLVLSEEEGQKGETFAGEIRKSHPHTRHIVLRPGTPIPEGGDMVLAVFSTVRAWKGDPPRWFDCALAEAGRVAEAIVCFGNPFVIRGAGAEKAKVYAWWGSEDAQRAAASKVLGV